MIPTSSIDLLRVQVANDLAEVRARRDRFIADRDRVEGDTTRSEAYVRDQVTGLREAAFRDFSEPHGKISRAAQIAGEQRAFWSNKLLVLSQRKFNDDPAIDANMALRVMTELNAMPAGLLQATADVARANRDFARLYHAVLAGQKYSRDEFSVDLGAVVLPEQVQALAALDEIAAMHGAADHAVNQTTASPHRGAETLSMARRMQPGGKGTGVPA